MNNDIKYKLANAMKECMFSSPVEKITVKEICDTCGVTRQTFYRNFQDKYDLINWYFDKILIESFHQMGEGSTVYESLVKKFEYIRMEQLFFKAAFKNDEQNNLKEHDFELIRQFYIDQIEGKSHRKISDKLLFQLEMYCQGSVFMTTQWALRQGSETICTVGAYALANRQAYMACGQTAQPLRGKGIGGRLIVQMANELAAKGEHPVFLCSPERVHFYTRLGFEKLGEYARYEQTPSVKT